MASAITDLASLDYWAHPGVDLHLITHPESEAEVRTIAPGTRVAAARGMFLPDFLEPRDRVAARAALGLPLEDDVVVVSGGGWAMGDLAGATEAVIALGGATAVVLTGRNAEVREELERRYAGQSRVRVLGFTEQMPDLLAGADALVHSTAGLTVLEAHCQGCPVISYGWGKGHIRANNRAFERFGLARVAPDRRARWTAALREALARREEPDRSFASLPLAARPRARPRPPQRGQRPPGGCPCSLRGSVHADADRRVRDGLEPARARSPVARPAWHSAHTGQDSRRSGRLPDLRRRSPPAGHSGGHGRARSRRRTGHLLPASESRCGASPRWPRSWCRRATRSSSTVTATATICV
ncbi:MAG: glycosyltransferase [Thermoleophilaceae bacterium]